MGWLGGSKRKIETLVDAHYEALYRYAYRLSGAPQAAEDLTQETFCQAQNKLGQLRDEEKAKSWLFSILRNAFLHRLRASKQEKEVCLDGIPEIPERAVDPGLPIDSTQLQQALSQLPEAFRRRSFCTISRNSVTGTLRNRWMCLGTADVAARPGQDVSAAAVDGSSRPGRESEPRGGTLMECQDVRQLLAFLERKSEELDAMERNALQKHLDTCPDCRAGGTGARRRSGDRHGPAMSPSLRASSSRCCCPPPEPRRAVSCWASARAAAVLFVIAAGTAWNYAGRSRNSPAGRRPSTD